MIQKHNRCSTKQPLSHTNYKAQQETMMINWPE